MSGLEVTKKGPVLELRLNRPEKRNCVSKDTYTAFVHAFQRAAQDDEVVLVTVTGTGSHFSSGNDLGALLEGAMSGEAPSALARQARGILQPFVDAWIDFPKPIIALVQGPAVGIAVTVLGLCDIVYASDRATFHTPFAALGQSPEACSSYVFPLMAGRAAAMELLMLGRRWSAREAAARGLVTRVFPHDAFRRETEALVRDAASLPPQSFRLIKATTRTAAERAQLRSVNAAECAVLEERWQSDECAQAVANFFQRKAKL